MRFFLLFIFLMMLPASYSEAAIALRDSYVESGTHVGHGGISEPAGAQEDDILILFLTGGTANTNFYGPKGWTLLYNLPSTTGADVWVYWIRRGASPPDLTTGWANSAYYEYSVTAWSGVVTTGNPFEVTANNARAQANPANPNSPAVVTTVPNTMIIAWGMSWNGWNTGGAGGVAGYTKLTGDCTATMKNCLAYKTEATFGSKDPAAYSNANTGNADKAEITLALKPQVNAVIPIISFKSSTINATTGTSLDPGEPADAALNDVLIAFVEIDSGYSNFAAPAGWTQKFSLTGGSADVKVFWIRRGASTAPTNFTWTGSHFSQISITAWKNVITTGDPFDSSTTYNAMSTGTVSNPPAVTPTVTNAAVIAMANNLSAWDQWGATAPSGYIKVEGSPGPIDLAIAYKIVAAPAAEDPGSFSAASTSGTKSEITLVLKPEVSPVVFRSKTVGYDTAVFTVDPGEPAGAAENDILIMWVVLESLATTPTTPTGWTNFASQTSSNADTHAYWIRRGTSAPVTAVSWSNAAYVESSITAWSGVDTSGTPFHGSPVVNARSSPNPGEPNCPAITTTVANTTIVGLGMSWIGAATTGLMPPSGYTRIEGGDVPTQDTAVITRELPTASTENPGNITNLLGTGSVEVAEITFAFAPKPTATKIRHRVYMVD